MPRQPLPSGADVVIVGGRAVGASAAFHLAEAGAEVVLLERDQLTRGSTSKAAGGLRAQFSDALNIEIAKRSLQAYKHFAERPGWEIDYEEIGYLFVLTTPAEIEAFTRSVALQNELGVPSRMITPEEAMEICPLLAVSTPVEGIDVRDGVITGVRTPHGTVATGTVISAAGAWSRACGELVG